MVKCIRFDFKKCFKVMDKGCPSPQPNQKRPLILVGPPAIGRHQLRQRLLDDTAKFAAPIPREQ